MVSILFIIGASISVVAFGFAEDLSEPTTVATGDDQCVQSIEFDPSDVQGYADDRETFTCVLWLDASQSESFENGEAVDRWEDTSTNEFDATPDETDPEWGLKDGVEAVNFDGVDGSSLLVDAPPQDLNIDADRGVTVVVMVYVADASNDDAGLYSIGEDGAGADGDVFAIRQSNNANEEWWVDPGDTFDITTEGRWAILTHTTDGNTFATYVNGEETASGDVEAVLNGPFELGSDDIRIGSTTEDGVFEGYVAEYFVANERIDDDKRAWVECGMSQKHGDIVDVSGC